MTETVTRVCPMCGEIDDQNEFWGDDCEAAWQAEHGEIS